jgi:hypothetical protein
VFRFLVIKLESKWIQTDARFFPVILLLNSPLIILGSSFLALAIELFSFARRMRWGICDNGINENG